MSAKNLDTNQITAIAHTHAEIHLGIPDDLLWLGYLQNAAVDGSNPLRGLSYHDLVLLQSLGDQIHD